LEISKGVRKRLDYYRSNLFWQSVENKKNILKMEYGMQTKRARGLGIEVLEFKKIDVCSVNGCLSSQLRKDCGNNYCTINIFKIKHWRKLRSSPQILLFGKV
jgi:hypothetical protein